MKYPYYIDSAPMQVDLPNYEAFNYGQDVVLSKEFGDLTYQTESFDYGAEILNSKHFYDHIAIKSDVERCVKRILGEISPTLNLDHYTIENHHRFVDDTQHLGVIAKTRRLFEEDFSVDLNLIVETLSDFLGVPLRTYRTDQHERQWTIVRINRPKSLDFNPAHKDIYESYDHKGEIPRMVNFWIPICGVNEKSGLPIAPCSHRLPESQILRSKAGANVNGVSYSVNSIMSWSGKSELVSMCPKEDQFLMFSSHLIHGLAFNGNSDTTRISLEFRLYEAT